jgi:hypothetical protein
VSTEARILVGAALGGLLVWLLLLVRRRQMRGKYVLFWFGAILVLEVLVVWPAAAAALVGGSGEQASFDGFILAVAGFSMLALVHVAWELSRLEERSRILAEEDALHNAPPVPAVHESRAGETDPNPARSPEVDD